MSFPKKKIVPDFLINFAAADYSLCWRAEGERHGAQGRTAAGHREDSSRAQDEKSTDSRQQQQ